MDSLDEDKNDTEADMEADIVEGPVRRRRSTHGELCFTYEKVSDRPTLLSLYGPLSPVTLPRFPTHLEPVTDECTACDQCRKRRGKCIRETIESNCSECLFAGNSEYHFLERKVEYQLTAEQYAQPLVYYSLFLPIIAYTSFCLPVPSLRRGPSKG
jgi:hypothetical protein